jgi:hypothetical protein
MAVGAHETRWGNVLKYQEYCEKREVLPRNLVECDPVHARPRMGGIRGPEAHDYAMPCLSLKEALPHRGMTTALPVTQDTSTVCRQSAGGQGWG